jgi:MSHA biogenesis protein MshN
MSVLNQMLRDLERRGAPAPVIAAAGTATVARPPFADAKPAADTKRRWIWAAVLAVVAAFAAAHAWLAYRVQEAARVRAPLGALTKSDAPAVAAITPAAATPPVPAAAATAAPDGVAASEPPVAAPPPALAAKRSAPRSAARPATPQAMPEPAPTPIASIERSRNDVAADLDRAAELIARGRNSEASTILTDVLARQPGHAAARSTLAALLAEAGRREAALAVLLAGIPFDPPRFSLPAAQLQAELGDVGGARRTLAAVPPAQRSAAHEALAAGLAARAGDHAAAVASYRRALEAPAANPVWWVGLALSLQASGDDAGAIDAYTRAAADARLPADVRGFVAEQLAARDGVRPARRGTLAGAF